MNLKCARCNASFEASTFRGYCPECLDFYAKQRQKVHAAQNPAPGVLCDGKFTTEIPHTVQNPFTEEMVCGLCGSDEIDPGYGLGSGGGMGSYNFCGGCNHFLDFVEDQD